MTFQRRQQDREQGLEALGANAIRGLPEHDQRLPDGLVVQSWAVRAGRRWRARGRRSAEEPDGVFSVIPGQRDEFIEDSTLPFECAVLIATPEPSY